MRLAHLLMRQASQQPDREAVYYGTTLHSTLGQWAARSATLAQHFRKSGLLPDDRIVLFMRNHPRYLEILWAAWWAGLIVVPVNAKLHTRELEWIVDNAQARWAFVTGDVTPGPLAGLERQIDIESEEADSLLSSLPDAMTLPITLRALGDVAGVVARIGQRQSIRLIAPDQDVQSTACPTNTTPMAVIIFPR